MKSAINERKLLAVAIDDLFRLYSFNRVRAFRLLFLLNSNNRPV